MKPANRSIQSWLGHCPPRLGCAMGRSRAGNLVSGIGFAVLPSGALSPMSRPLALGRRDRPPRAPARVARQVMREPFEP